MIQNRKAKSFLSLFLVFSLLLSLMPSVFAANTVNYKVERYLQNLNNDEYTLNAEGEKTFQAEEGTSVTLDLNDTAKFTQLVGFTARADNVLTKTIAADGSTLFKVYYDRNVYNLDINGTKSQVKYGTLVDKPADPVKDGAVFQYWVDGNNNKITFPTTIYTNTVIKPVFSGGQAAYKVEHYQQKTSGDEYTLAKTQNLIGTAGTTVTASLETFTGFTAKSGQNLTAVIKDDGSTVIKVYYDRTICYVAVRGGNTYSVRYGAVMAQPDFPVKNGYIGDYWTDESGKRVDFSQPITSSMTISPQYRLDTSADGKVNYTVEYYQSTLENKYERKGSDTLRAFAGEQVTITPKTFTGFSLNTKNSSSLTVTVSADGSTVVKLYYDRYYYKVTFDSQGGTSVNSVNALYGASIKLPDLVRAGYTFDGWYTEAAGGKKVSQNYTVEKDITLYAQWKTGSSGYSYTIRFDSQGGTVIDNVTGSYGYGFVLPTPARPGYIFDGWYTSLYNGTKVSSPYKITGSTTLYARWKESSFTNKDYKFTDVNQGDWFYNDVVNAVNLGYIEPASNTQFNPNAPLTRAEMAKMLSVLKNGNVSWYGNTYPYKDVTVNTRYHSEIAWAKNDGVMVGYGYNSFGPGDSLTREQMSMILWRTLKDLGMARDTSNRNGKDFSRVSSWAKDAVNWAVETGIMWGDNNGDLMPLVAVTRAQACALMMRAVNIRESTMGGL